MAGAALVEKLDDQWRPGLQSRGAVLINEMSDGFGGIGIEAPVELVEDFAGAAHGLGITRLEDLTQGGLGRFARFPEGFRRRFALLEGIAGEPLDPFGDLFLRRRPGRWIGG